MSTSCNTSPYTPFASLGNCMGTRAPTPYPQLDSFAKYSAQNGVPDAPNPVTPWNINHPPASLLPKPTPYAQWLYQAWLAEHPA